MAGCVVCCVRSAMLEIILNVVFSIIIKRSIILIEFCNFLVLLWLSAHIIMSRIIPHNLFKIGFVSELQTFFGGRFQFGEEIYGNFLVAFMLI